MPHSWVMPLNSTGKRNGKSTRKSSALSFLDSSSDSDDSSAGAPTTPSKRPTRRNTSPAPKNKKQRTRRKPRNTKIVSDSDSDYDSGADPAADSSALEEDSQLLTNPCKSKNCSNTQSKKCYGYCNKCHKPGQGAGLWLPPSGRNSDGSLIPGLAPVRLNMDAMAAAAAAPSVVTFADGRPYDMNLHTTSNEGAGLTWMSIFVTKNNTDIELFMYFYRAAE